jgi:hypothetical protein
MRQAERAYTITDHWTFLAHVRQRTSGGKPEEQSDNRSEGKPIKRGHGYDQVLSLRRRR